MNVVCMRLQSRAPLLTLLLWPSAFRSCTTRTATGTRTVSAVPSATSRWPASSSTHGTMARSCVASVAPGRMGTGARAATRWSCQVGVLTVTLYSECHTHSLHWFTPWHEHTTFCWSLSSLEISVFVFIVWTVRAQLGKILLPQYFYFI